MLELHFHPKLSVPDNYLGPGIPISQAVQLLKTDWAIPGYSRALEENILIVKLRVHLKLWREYWFLSWIVGYKLRNIIQDWSGDCSSSDCAGLFLQQFSPI